MEKINLYSCINVYFVNKDGSEGYFDNSIHDELVELARDGKLDAESCLRSIEARYEGDSDLVNCDHITRIEITRDGEEILCAFDYE